MIVVKEDFIIYSADTYKFLITETEVFINAYYAQDDIDKPEFEAHLEDAYKIGKAWIASRRLKSMVETTFKACISTNDYLAVLSDQNDYISYCKTIMMLIESVKESRQSRLFYTMRYMEPLYQAAQMCIKPIDGYIYLIQKEGTDYYKIGKSNQPDVRLRKFDVVLPFPIEPIHLIACSNYDTAERLLHAKYLIKRKAGEWFELTPEQVAEIKAITRM